ncbi:MAG: DUF885 domain-containing protein [Acidobacteria bacterium]|nr:DUF885 domain-containing protein [Acidobacteriota bacterium]
MNNNQASNANAASRANPEWDKYVEQFLTDYFTANPTFAVYQGRHEFDGKLPDWSAEGLSREVARLKSERGKTTAFRDDQLDENQRFERDYLIAQIDGDLFWLETADLPHTSPYYYGNALDPDVYVSREYAPLETRIKAYTSYARNVPGALEQIKSNLRLPLPRNFLAIGRQTIGGLADFLEKDVITVFAPVSDAQAQNDFKLANAAAAKSIREFDAWLGQQESAATNNFALGPDKFRQMLKQTEGVDIDLAELERIARSDMDRNLASFKQECEKFAPGASLQECNSRVSAMKPEGGAVEAAKSQLTDLRKFVQEKDLVTIPGTEECKVDQAPAYKAWNFAYINIPGRGSLLSTSVHEAYPGHFLQFLHSNRVKSKIAKVFVGYANAEGWAHYTEEMMQEAGLMNGDPEYRLGMLQDALLRNARFVSAIGLHTKGMTVEESKRLFMEAMQSEGEAEQQANRGTFDPAYLNYTMGKLMIMKLRNDWTASRGGRGAWKQFHDQFLSYGGPQVPMVRKAMMGKDDKGPFF